MHKYFEKKSTNCQIMQFIARNVFYKLTVTVLCLIILGILFSVYHMLQVNQIRGDEFLSFLHSDPEQFELLQVLQNIYNGADHSYVHAGFVWMAFKLFGYHIVVQRGVSMFFWLLSGWLLYMILRKWNWSNLQISLAIALILFSNLGIFLATDGRFYSMVMFFALLQMHLLLSMQEWKIKDFICIFILQLLSLLVSPIMLLWSMMLSAAWAFQGKYEARKLLIILAVAGSYLVYYFFFRVKAFDSYFADAYFNFTFLFRPEITLIEWPFRWVMLPDIPFLSDQVDGLIILIAIVVLFIAFYKRKYKLDLPLQVVLVSLVFAGIVLVLVLLTIFTDVQQWPVRYFAFAFFLLGIVLTALIFVFEKHPSFYAMLTIFTLLLLGRSVAELNKMPERYAKLRQLEQQVLNDDETILHFCECDSVGDYAQFLMLGERYVHYPILRNKLVFSYDSKDPMRAAYFNRLKAMNYRLKMIFNE